LIRVVRVDDDRFRQLPRGAGELAQDEHPSLVVARRHEFLRHQVHAVVQARDHAHVRGAIVFVDVQGLVVLHQQHDRWIGGGGEALVDARRHAPHPRFVFLILLDAVARRGGDLDEREPADPVGLHLQ